MLAFWSWRVVNIWVRCRCVAFLNRRPSRIFLSCEKHITLELSRVSITNADNKRNSFIVSVANRCRFVVILKFYACTVYSWLISMLKWAFYRQDVWKTPYFITHTVFKKNKSLHSGLMFCFRIVQGYMEIFPVLFPSLILVSVGILKIRRQTFVSTCLCRNLRSFSESYVDRFFLFKIWLIDKERIQPNLCQIYAKFMHLLCSGVLKSLSSINKQTIFGFDFHKSDKHFTGGRDYQGYLLTKLPVNTF